MFHPIDYEVWPRREIYDLFRESVYNLTVELDVTEFVRTVHENGLKFYACACWCIAKTVNADEAYRFGVHDGKIGFWDSLKAHYSLRRADDSGLFTHNVTPFTPVFADFYRSFMAGKPPAEQCGRLYYYTEPQPDAVHITIMPGTHFSALSYSKQVVTGCDTSYIPFVTMGQYREENGRLCMPVNVLFCHAVNDGRHSARFFELLEQNFREFRP